MHQQLARVVVVTGAGSGIGRAIYEGMARAGDIVYAGMRDIRGRNAARSARVLALAKDEGLTLIPLELDVLDESSLADAIDRVVSEQHRVDVIVNNAGMLMSGVAEAYTPEQFLRILDTNAVSWLRVARAVLPRMRRQRRGTIVYVSSGTAHIAEPFLGVYNASKAAGEWLAESIALEIAPSGIDTIILVPGAFSEGTKHFAHSVPPEDLAIVAQYGPLPARVAGLPARLAQIDEERNGRAADVRDVAAALLDVLERPVGERPLRVIVDAQRRGLERIDAVRRDAQLHFFEALGLDDLLTITANEPSPPRRKDMPENHLLTTTDTEDDMTSTEHDTQTTAVRHDDPIMTFYAGIGGRPDLMESVIAEDWEDIPLAPGQLPGRAGAAPLVDGFATVFPDIWVAVHQVVDGRGADGDGMVAVRGEMHGTQHGEWFGVAGTGQTTAIRIHDFHEVVGGRIARTWHLEDWFGWMQRAGA